MNLRQLETFCLVVELGSFTRAARVLHMTQPAVSLQIKNLEEELGLPLLERGEKTLITTDGGQLLYQQAKRILMEWNILQEGLEQLKTSSSGSIRLAASTIPGEYLLPYLLAAFRKNNPAVDLGLHITDSEAVGQLLRERVVHLGITGVAIRDPVLDCQPWCDDEILLVVGPTHSWFNLDELEPTQLLETCWIFREQGSGTRKVVEDRLQGVQIEPTQLPILMELGSSRAVVTAVLSGLGAGWVSYLAVADLLAEKKIKALKVKGLNLKRTFYLLRHRQAFLPPVVSKFYDFLLVHARHEISSFLPDY